MKKAFILLLTITIAGLLSPAKGHAATACSTVKIEILQSMTLERIAFDAKLKVTNNITGQSLENLRVDLVIRDNAGNDQTSLFYIKAPECTGVLDVSGTGSVASGTPAEVHWLIIPSPGAGGSATSGTVYWVGATMSYKVGADGQQETIPINPCSITVKPEPQLYLDYFSPYQVLGDNPFTDAAEAPVPYQLGVRVFNDGYGDAKSLKITSSQPEIVENSSGLLIGYQILGTEVNDQAVANTLAVSFGDIASKKCATADWQMICTLSGRFTNFDVTFSHASELGGDLTSLLKETNAHYLVHMVKDNLPGRDNLLDFLGSESPMEGTLLPEYIMESEIPAGKTDPNVSDRDWSVSLVSVEAVTSAPGRPTASSPNVDMTISRVKAGWVFATTDDPSQGLLNLVNVQRADGEFLDPNNFWIQEYLDDDYQSHHSLNILDYRADTGVTGTYHLVYEQPPDDTTPPVTSLVYEGKMVEESPKTGDTPQKVSVTPSSRILFTAEDNTDGSGVASMMKKVTGSAAGFTSDTDFGGAYPLNLTGEGSYTLQYYSKDYSENVEATQTVDIVVDNSPPNITSFGTEPASFSPGAPKGVRAERTADFVLSASDLSDKLTVTLQIAKGEGDFGTLQAVRNMSATATSSQALRVTWDGNGDDGSMAALGKYTAKATVTDGLGSTSDDTAHTSTATAVLEIKEWFTGTPVDPNLSGEQLYPKVYGTRAVWQDKRSGHWQIYTKDLTGGSSAVVGSGNGDSERPSINGDIIAWQDNRDGGYRIYYYDLIAGQEHPVDSDPQGLYPGRSEEKPVVYGGWIAWQDNRNGNRDIFAYSTTSGEVRQVTSHERDQLNPAMDGTKLYWEDYRHGAAEIYSYDLDSGSETRVTYNDADQTGPAVSGNELVWTDTRDGGNDIYLKDGTQSETRLTYGSPASQPAILGNVLVYTDSGNGATDTNLAFLELSASVGGLLTENTARQEEPAVGTGYVFWQDDRDGVFQVYAAPFEVEAQPVGVEIKRGYNLVAAGSLLAATYPTASTLIDGVKAELGVDRVMIYDSLHARAVEAADTGGAQVSGEDFGITPGSGLVLYAGQPGSLNVADSSENVSYTLLPGTNQVGMLKASYGYRAYDLMNSVGLGNIQSVRRFNTETGSWETAAVRDKEGVKETVGTNFEVAPGDGLIITMKQRVDGWKP